MGQLWDAIDHKLFEILQIATLCLDGNFAHSWHSLNQLHEEVTWNAFQLILNNFFPS